jgi:glyoxylase-like metal-dependent hydrolase (beta-lactamase superfamily II)
METIQLTSILGNGQKLDGGSMFGNAPRAIWEKWTEVDEQNRIDLCCRCLLIEANGLRVLCEAGIGAFFEPKMAERFGVQNSQRHLLREHLLERGIELEQIDYVILSHLHFDHAGGLLPTFKEISQGNDGLIFPRAQFLVGEEAWQRAQMPHLRDRASFIPGLCEKLLDSGRLQIVKGPKPPTKLAPFIRFSYSQGHTPGQMHTSVFHDEKEVFFAGDLIPGAFWVHLPITMGYDRFPEALIDEKSQLLERVSKDQTMIFFTHDTHWAAARVVQDEKGRFQVSKGYEKLDKYLL